ncbi:unnamed protein product [Orchesella dallaii]|uniref:Pacifastin domain-containing protein n=1 Tax=Orchesella dallaii TaxID=48710 RepID=A0ABP1RTW7_9HEXA
MQSPILLSFLLFYLVTTVSCRTVRESLKRSSEKEATLKHYRNQFSQIHDALSGSVESLESTITEGPSYRIDLGEGMILYTSKRPNFTVIINRLIQDLIWSSQTALEAESFRAAAISSDSVELSHEGRNPEEGEVETTTLFPIQSIVGNSQWLKSDLDEEDAEEDEEAMDDGCDEGEVIKVSCNSCVCINSQYVCSKKDCQELQEPLPPMHIKHSSKKKGSLNYNKKGQSVTVDDSGNTLYGEYFSSELESSNATFPREEQATEFSCIDGRTKPVDCNHCICAMGKWACTKMSCIPMSLREKASFHGAEFIKKADTLKENMGIDEDCLEGDTKKVSGCNQCVCHENSWACTDYECPSMSPPVKPNSGAKLEACQTEEDVKSVECNICSCRSGIWRCTNNDCKKFGDKYYQPIQRGNHKSSSPMLMDSDSAENHSYL